MLLRVEEVSNDLNNASATSFRTIFYQGIFCSQVILSRYNGGKEFLTTTGQLVSCDVGRNLKPMDVLVNPFVGAEIQDVEVLPFGKPFSLLNPLTLFSTVVPRASNWYNGIKVKNDASWSAQNGDIRRYSLRIEKISIGQETDIASLQEKFALCLKSDPNASIILWGVSRGAATVFNWLAKYFNQVTTDKMPIKIVILEGCFYSFEDILARWFSYGAKQISKLISYFTQYSQHGPQPATSVDNFPENVPVVFITSKKDRVVPWESTQKLAYALRDRGKNDIYLFVLKNSSHTNYPFDDKNDRKDYESLIHAIYEKYHIVPFDKELAEHGKTLLKECTLYESPKQELTINDELRSTPRM